MARSAKSVGRRKGDEEEEEGEAGGDAEGEDSGEGAGAAGSAAVCRQAMPTNAAYATTLASRNTLQRRTDRE